MRTAGFYASWIFTLILIAGCSPVQAVDVQVSPTAVQIAPVATAAPAATAPAPLTQTAPVPTQVKTMTVPSIDPLTGLPPETAERLNRRPVIIKVENLPRNHRPQYGLSFADLVYEYHTEEGTTRYAGVFYGRNTSKVGPIRSGRWFDINLIQMYKSLFIFGSAYDKLLHALFNADFADRLILEGPATSAALQRFDPNGKNLLLANLDRLPEIISSYAIDNAPQPLDGMVLTPIHPRRETLPNKFLCVIREPFTTAGITTRQWAVTSVLWTRRMTLTATMKCIPPCWTSRLDSRSRQITW